MPIYDYQCSECSHVLEAIQKFSDPLLTDCPECGKPALKKLVSAPSFRLAGGGWYETDFKTGSKKNLAGDSSSGATSGASSSDAKPAASKTDSSSAA